MPDKEERFTSYVKLVQEILQLLQTFVVWKVLCPAAFTSLAIILLCQIPSASTILGDMLQIIRNISAVVFVLTLTGISYKCAESVFLQLKARIEKHLREQYTERHKQEEQAEQIATVAKILQKLPARELSILKYMHEKGGIVWLPIKEGAVLNLCDMSCVYSATINATMLRGELFGEYSQCLACKITPLIENNIENLTGDLFDTWEQLEPATWLSVYEQSLE